MTETSPSGPAGAANETEPVRLESGLHPFAAAVMATRMPMLITDAKVADNPFIFTNEAFCRLTGYERDEIIGRNCRFLQGPGTDPRTVARLRAAIGAADPIEIDIRNYRKNGEPFWNRLLLVPVCDAAGILTHFLANQVDVTAERDRVEGLEKHNVVLGELAERLTGRAHELAQANQKLTIEMNERAKISDAVHLPLEGAYRARSAMIQSEMHLRSILDTVPDAMIIIDSAARIQSFSATATLLLGYRRDEVMGQNVSMLMPSCYS